MLLAGDFNARIGALPETPPTAALPPRGLTDAAVTGHGQLLAALCRRCDLLLGTGRLPGDEDACPTFRARQHTQATRPDHVVFKRATYSRAVSSVVNTSRQDSDHFPIEIQLRFPVRITAHLACQGTALPHLKWSPDKRDHFARALSSDDTASLALQSCRSAASTACVDGAFQALHTAVCAAASSAGVELRACGSRRPNGAQHRPFFDAQCLASKRAVRACARHGSREELRLMERQYHSLVRSKQRAYRHHLLQQLLLGQVTDPRHFWKRLRSDHAELPPQLQAVQQWEQYLRQVGRLPLPAGCALPDGAFPQQHPEHAAVLNAPIGLDEVQVGLRCLHNGRSSGQQGVPAEFLRYAQCVAPAEGPCPPHVLAPILQAVLNSAFQAGHVPAAFNAALVTPVFKRGDACDPGNYRPIAVTEPVMRLYANILNARLVQFAERQGLRSPGQAGFRPGLSTLHPLFTLQHFVDSAIHTAQPLYCCFLDLKGAYDRVQRPLLWQVLQRLGVHGRMLGALQSLYANSTVAMRVGGRTGLRVPSETGVRQGCPLSPTLFGLFLDGLHQYIALHCPTEGPMLHGGRPVPDLAYADDVTLLAVSPEGLQRLIACASAFCAAVGLAISPGKTNIVVFGSPDPVSFPWTCDGQPVQCCSSVKYLGLMVDSQRGILQTFTFLHQKMWAAWSQLRRQYANLRCAMSISLLLRVYEVCVPPVASYACELWGQSRLSAPLRRQRSQLEQSHAQILRMILGLRASVPAPMVFSEVGSAPLSHAWWLRAIRFWNALAAMPASSLFAQVALSNCRDAVVHNVHNWAFSFMTGLRSLDYAFTLRCDRLDVVDVACVTELLRRQLARPFQDIDVCPRTCPSNRAMLCTYLRWFSRPAYASSVLPRRLSDIHVSASALKAFFRFRCGSHNLPNDIGRRNGTPRVQRFCAKCSAQQVGDEYHLVFECSAVQHVRDQYQHLFTGPHQTMREFMWQPDMKSVVLYVRDSLSVLLGDHIGIG